MKPNNLQHLHLHKIDKIHHNLSYEELNKHEHNEQGVVGFSHTGALVIDTGEFTGRSPKDKYLVKQTPSENSIAWGSINQPTSKEVFDELFELVLEELHDEIYVTDVFCGSDKSSRINARVVSKISWQSHFVKNMFIEPTKDELENFDPTFTIYNASNLANKNYQKHGLNSEVFVIFNLEAKIAIIGGTSYTGEMKKGFFSLMNYLLPLQDKLPMHCSANIGKDGDTCLFFGLSGTGKTTLSTDPHRKLIGDDEHGWDENGVFNFEGGCYAKVINLDKDSEPDIYGAIRTDALLENVSLDSSGQVDYKDSSKTENTRVSYPIEHIANHEPSLRGGHPNNIIFLTADAFGVLPPVSKLTAEQAMYYFLSGYTSKVAGTERGITEPQATFSAAFGEVFLPLSPMRYAELLGEKIQKHSANIFLVNSGWMGGAYGVGKRISIKDTRTCVDNILSGDINGSEFEALPIFGLSVPKAMKNINSQMLNPRNLWQDKEAYDATLQKLANMFVTNFKRYDQYDGATYSKAGPQL